MPDHPPEQADPPQWHEWLEVSFHAGRLHAIRRLVAGFAERCGASPEKASALVLAAGELAAHAVTYGGGQGLMRLWREGEVMLCQVVDGGSDPGWLTDRLADAPDGTSDLHALADSLLVETDGAATTVTIGVWL